MHVFSTVSMFTFGIIFGLTAVNVQILKKKIVFIIANSMDFFSLKYSLKLCSVLVRKAKQNILDTGYSNYYSANLRSSLAFYGNIQNLVTTIFICRFKYHCCRHFFHLFHYESCTVFSVFRHVTNMGRHRIGLAHQKHWNRKNR